MSEGVTLALLAALVFGFLGISFDMAGKRRYVIWDVILWKQIGGLLIGMGALWFTGDTNLVSTPMLGIGIVAALAYVVSLAAYLVASQERELAANWTIGNLSVVLAILASVIWFGDEFTAMRGLGIVLTLASIVSIGGFQGAGQQGSRWRAAMAVAFLLSPVLPVLFRFVPPGSEVLFTVYFHAFSVVTVIAYKLVLREPVRAGGGLMMVSLLAAFSHWTGIMFTMLALAKLANVTKQAGVIVYPITNGLVIPVGVILGVILLKQRISFRTGVGVALGAVSLVFLSLA